MARDKNAGRKKNPPAGPADRITRREWLAEVGAVAVVRGLPARFEGARTRHETALPPGLYAPSSEHLGHALESDELFHAVPAGSKTDYARPLAGEFEPAFFSRGEFQIVRRLVELILGLRPGARDQTGENREDVQETVARWIDLQVASAAGVRKAARALSPEHRAVALRFYGPESVHRLQTEAPETTCREGLGWLEHVSQQRHGEEFFKLSEQQQLEILEGVSDLVTRQSAGNPGTRFFTFLKAETVRGYYTSREGLHELDYKGNSFYPKSPGCPKSATSRHAG